MQLCATALTSDFKVTKGFHLKVKDQSQNLTSRITTHAADEKKTDELRTS